jgi:hypothetical protein
MVVFAVIQVLMTLASDDDDDRSLSSSELSTLGWPIPSKHNDWVCREENTQELCNSWILHPGFMSYSPAARFVAGFLACVWCLMGLNLLSSICVRAAELAASREIKTHGDMGDVTIRVWRPVQAGVALFAVPRLPALFAIIEAIKVLIDGSETDSLMGPSTVVGSVVFNTLICTGMCLFVASLQNIPSFTKFSAVAIVSFMAFFFVYIVTEVWTKNRISWVEALIIFLGYPLSLVRFQCAHLMQRKTKQNKSKKLFSKLFFRFKLYIIGEKKEKLTNLLALQVIAIFTSRHWTDKAKQPRMLQAMLSSSSKTPMFFDEQDIHNLVQ